MAVEVKFTKNQAQHILQKANLFLDINLIHPHLVAME
jgi:hypothetical protein